jgi:MFS family permease
MKRILPVIVISQFFCTSLWFAGNAVVGDISKQFHVDPGYLAELASAVQLGFISGTLIFALLGISDRFSSPRVFVICAIIASLLNVSISFNGINSSTLLLLRYLTGFFLAGIYPVGMKIASDHYQKGLGKSLGFLVGALVLGTSLPHLLKTLTTGLPWKYVIYSTSLLAASGGLLLYLLVPDVSIHKSIQRLNWKACVQSFQNKNFRAAAFGYFGHMWELYAFWVFVPVILATYQKLNPAIHFNIPLLSFLIIASGSVACIYSGHISQKYGAKKIATIALSISCLCCLISPILFLSHSVVALIIFLFIWGMTVIADSPLFSTLVAQNAAPAFKGTALTIVTCIGFATTIFSIQLINTLITDFNAAYIYLLLAPGPIFGLIALFSNKN